MRIDVDSTNNFIGCAHIHIAICDMDGTLILIILLVALNIQLVDIDKRVLFVVFGLIPYPLIFFLAPPQSVSQEAALYRNENTILGEVATCLLIIFLQFFPVYASEFFSQYSAYQQNIIVENTKQLSLQQEGKWDLLKLGRCPLQNSYWMMIRN